MLISGPAFLIILCTAPVLHFVTANASAGNISSSECRKRPWPILSLFLPVGLKPNALRNSEWSDVFLLSIRMHWPVAISNTSIVVILDTEIKGSQLQAEYVDAVIEEGRSQSNFPHIDVKYHVPNISYNHGHDRQQHVMFSADLYTDADYIGFVDSDCLIYANVDREDLFENGKPVVHGRIGYLRKHDPRHSSPAATYNFLKMEQPMICMAYFPVIVKASHLKNLRDHVENLHGLSFDKAFSTHLVTMHGYSQFNVMCTYMWHKARNEYAWHIHDETPWWNGLEPKPAYGQWSEKYIFKKEMFSVKPFISTHVRYRGCKSAKIPFHGICKKQDTIHAADSLNRLILRAMCHTKPENNCLKINCTEYLAGVNHFNEMHIFEDANYNDKINITDARDTQLERVKRFANCDLYYGCRATRDHFAKFNYSESDYNNLLNSLTEFSN